MVWVCKAPAHSPRSGTNTGTPRAPPAAPETAWEGGGDPCKAEIGAQNGLNGELFDSYGKIYDDIFYLKSVSYVFAFLTRMSDPLDHCSCFVGEARGPGPRAPEGDLRQRDQREAALPLGGQVRLRHRVAVVHPGVQWGGGIGTRVLPGDEVRRVRSWQERANGGGGRLHQPCKSPSHSFNPWCSIILQSYIKIIINFPNRTFSHHAKSFPFNNVHLPVEATVGIPHHTFSSPCLETFASDAVLSSSRQNSPK